MNFHACMSRLGVPVVFCFDRHTFDMVCEEYRALRDLAGLPFLVCLV